MTERPLIVNAEMVRAILDGRKTQTRRIIQSPARNMQATGKKVIDYREPGDKWYGEYIFSMRNQSGTWCDYTKEQFLAKCPFGAVGDRLWVREAFRVHSLATDLATLVYKASERNSWTEQTHRVPVEQCNKPVSPFNFTPSIHMPRWASRITLEITGVRVERLRDLSEEDARAEGITPPAGGVLPGWKYRINFRDLWISIYGADNWEANPWVWVVEFKRVEGGSA
ncbi:hypothetical protein PTT43_002920 [Cronobacter turicensis]|uniref:hypothetical protein n=1 Tax=Cronobacter dublinensis TaxID=413497 RepID=UPI0005184BCA|nr:hypothetical protein [Cronobacter dublinensis]EKM0364278.1 hypothetical protein [Cronobacter turicensis]MDI6442080.1 hypothetical protein [Cronobacter dublinensis]